TSLHVTSALKKATAFLAQTAASHLLAYSVRNFSPNFRHLLTKFTANASDLTELPIPALLSERAW
ncbi:hypothetical protein OV924_25735, partial [Salmonella enterica subsp. enterica serovar 1,4,[5],12:i:-]|uniref:hypothetical protein n=1 Tax=Salmonella sp. L-S2353 TaxID=2933301 RepID=UPI001FF31C05|nr:hypothetical protein [Salmonella sp. L-S2353]MCY6187770.1 hypothetical protein [Salmonella enterica subsp. enterica serovar 1,4,[5],12:i:-]